MARRYPVGIQTFSEIIEDGYVYVDKTEIIYNMTQKYKFVFFGRPRRFGKSLLVSTMKEYFSGNRELFKGLKIDSLEAKWEKYPVLTFNMSSLKRDTVSEIKSGLSFKLDEYEKKYDITEKASEINDRFTNLIKIAHKKTGKKVVILIDEYDAPLLNVLYEDNMEQIRRTMRSFYSPIKDCDEHIHFAFMTGITKFSQLSIFSELNNLAKISMYDEVSALCGVTQTELDTVLKEDVELLADKLKLTYEETREKLKENYDGYRFSKNGEYTYNPFSLLSCFNTQNLDYFWFDSATPTFLIKSMQKFNFRINDTEELECPDTQFDVSATDLDSAIPLLYQSGYLTIKEFYPEMNLYRLDIPNKEVRIGLLESLYPSVFPNLENKNEFWIWKFAKDIKLGNTDSFMTRLKSLIASMPYATGKNAELVNEQNIQNGFFLIFNLMGQFTRSEVHSLKGRSDCAVETSDTVYLFEFKISGNGTADDALAQIDKKDYTCSYEAGGKRIVKIGVAFDKDVREFADVKIVM